MSCFVFAGAAAAAPLDITNPPVGRFSDEWLEVHMLGGKVGYGHSTMTRKGDTVHTETFMYMKIDRANMPVTMEVRQRTEETLDGKPLAYSSEMKAATMSTGTRGKVADGVVTHITSQFGMEQKQTFKFSEGSLMTWGQYREGIKRGFEPKSSYTIRAFAPDLRLDDSVDVTVNVLDWEDYQHNGKQRGLKVLTTMSTPMGDFKLSSWVDANGVPRRSIIPMPGMGNLEVYSVDQATALADFVPPEMFMSSTVAAKVRIDRRNVRQIEYRVKARDESISLGAFPNTAMQQATEGEDGVYNITSMRLTHASGSGPTQPLSADERKEYLGSNLMINTEDPELIALAKKAAGGEKDPYKLADKLRKFVTGYISDKNLDVAFATASEVCRRKSGDCSEHGVLLAALGRINNIPSRVVVGLAYVPLFGRQQDIYGYHMWTQFHLNGRWIDVDAALEETNCSPARIAMAVSSLQNAGMADLALPLLQKIGAIDMQILKIDGKAVSAP